MLLCWSRKKLSPRPRAGHQRPLLPERASFGRTAWRLLKTVKIGRTGLTSSPTKNWKKSSTKWSRITEVSG